MKKIISFLINFWDKVDEKPLKNNKFWKEFYKQKSDELKKFVMYPILALLLFIWMPSNVINNIFNYNEIGYKLSVPDFQQYDVEFERVARMFHNGKLPQTIDEAKNIWVDRWESESSSHDDFIELYDAKYIRVGHTIKIFTGYEGWILLFYLGVFMIMACLSGWFHYNYKKVKDNLHKK